MDTQLDRTREKPSIRSRDLWLVVDHQAGMGWMSYLASFHVLSAGSFYTGQRRFEPILRRYSQARHTAQSKASIRSRRRHRQSRPPSRRGTLSWNRATIGAGRACAFELRSHGSELGRTRGG
jgi:hypothetical protein